MHSALTALTLLALLALVVGYVWMDIHLPMRAKRWQRAANWTAVVLASAATAFASMWLEMPEGLCILFSVMTGGLLTFFDPIAKISGRSQNRDAVKKPAYGLAISYWSNHLRQVIDAAKDDYVLSVDGRKHDKSKGIELLVVDPRLHVSEISTGNVGSLAGALLGTNSRAEPRQLLQVILQDERSHYLYAVPPQDDLASQDRPTLLSFPTGLSILADYVDHVLPKDLKRERRDALVQAEIDEFFEHLSDLLEPGLHPRGIFVRRVEMRTAQADPVPAFNFRVRGLLKD